MASRSCPLEIQTLDFIFQKERLQSTKSNIWGVFWLPRFKKWADSGEVVSFVESKESRMGLSDWSLDVLLSLRGSSTGTAASSHSPTACLLG